MGVGVSGKGAWAPLHVHDADDGYVWFRDVLCSVLIVRSFSLLFVGRKVLVYAVVLLVVFIGICVICSCRSVC